jgi:hypothetical protein
VSSTGFSSLRWGADAEDVRPQANGTTLVDHNSGRELVFAMRSPRLNFSAGSLQDYFGLSGRIELWIAVGLFGLGCLFKFWNVFLFRFDSDEPQHLHVVWAWTHGLVQYRDVFDNHMPLFHLLCAPILGLLGEHAADLYWMRLLMVPLYFLSLWCVYRIGAIAFSRGTGLWALLLASGISVYHFSSTEFRTDDVWSVLWFLCLMVLVRNPFDLRSIMVSGLLLGLAFGISMKTVLMLVTLLSAFGIATALVGWRRIGLTLKGLGLALTVFTICMAAVPLLIIGFFTGMGVWSQFRYCVFTHNFEPATLKIYLKPLMFLTGTPILIYATSKFVGRETNATVAFRQAFVCLTCGLYFLLMQGFWRHLTRETYMPLFPLVALVSVALLSKVPGMLAAQSLAPVFLIRSPLSAIAASLVMLLDLGLRLPVTNEADKEISRLRDVLALTNPTDRVFDCKGETVFRPRSVRYVIETITSGRLERGEIVDEFEIQSPQTRARVAVVGGEIPEWDETFIERNYLPVGHGVLVAGSRLNGASAGASIRFHIGIPDRYQIITPDGQARGVLDGSLSQGSRFLEVGDHTFVPATENTALAALWSQAVDRHFTNFVDAPPLHPVKRNPWLTKAVRPMVDISTEIPEPFHRPVSVVRLWNRSSP